MLFRSYKKKQDEENLLLNPLLQNYLLFSPQKNRVYEIFRKYFKTVVVLHVVQRIYKTNYKILPLYSITYYCIENNMIGNKKKLHSFSLQNRLLSVVVGNLV